MTNDKLLAEAREWCKDHRGGYQEYPGGPLIEYDGIDMVKRLADALEAKTGVRVDLDSAEGVEAQIAARQPSEDDREAVTGKELADAVHVYREASGKPANSEGIRAVLAFSRAAVPDAATGREIATIEEPLPTQPN